MRVIAFSIVFLVCLVFSIAGIIFDNHFLAILASLSSMIIGEIISLVFQAIDSHGHSFKLWFQHFKYWNKDIRLSISYLYRIQIDGKYLLVKGNRLNRYQPVGGVYKYYAEAKPALESFCYRPDIEMGNTDATDDLRIRIPGKYLLSFMTWFSAMRDREYDPTREFYEELVETGLLPADEFAKIQYRKIRTHNNGVQYSNYMDCEELLYADIFELKLTSDQSEIIKQCVAVHPDKLCLASDSEIKKMRYGSVEQNIGNNAIWLLED